MTTPGRTTTAARTGRPPLVGRDAELQRFRDLLAAGRRGVVLRGAAGVGKTRLADELCAIGARQGMVTRFVSGRGSTADIPLVPFASLLAGDVGAHHGVSLLVEARGAIERLGAGRSVLLGVDDAHQLDAASATLVHQLVTTGSIVAVVTVRTDEWVPPPIAELWRSGLLEVWDVAALDRADAVRLALDTIGGTSDVGLAEEIGRLSGGNPLFVTTLVRAATEHGGDLSDLATAPELVDVVGAELRSLPPPDRDALAVVALAEPIGVSVLEQLVDASTLITLERGGWITVEEDRRRTDVRLRHPLFGDVLRGTISRMLARSVYAELAQVIQGHGARRRTDPLRVAFWSLEGGHPIEHSALARAAADAFDAGDLDLAVRFAEVVWTGPSEDHRFAAGMILRAARAAAMSSEPVAFSTALARLATTPGQVVALELALADEELWRTGDTRGVRARLERLLETVRGGDAAPDATTADPTTAACADLVLAHRARAAALAGDVGTATADLDVLRASDAGPDALAVAVEALVTVSGAPSPDADRIVAWVAEDPDAPANPVLGRRSRRALCSGMSRWLVQQGRLHDAEAWARATADDATVDHVLGHRPQADLAWVLAWRGDAESAMTLARRAADRQRRLGLHLLERWSRLVEALAACYRGDGPAARAALADVDRLGPEPTVARRGDELYVRSMLAEVDGDMGTALALAEELIDDAAVNGAWFDEALGWMSVAWLAPRPDAATNLARIAAAAGGVALVFAPYAAARLRDDVDGIADSAEHAERLGMTTISATFMRQAADVASARDQRLAARLARRAAELHRGLSLGGPYDAPGPGEPLSRREREIAELAAAGWSSREIGERLFLSTRTVDNHLARAYDKLGVDGRDELATALRDA